jgi:hypothetical protein
MKFGCQSYGLGDTLFLTSLCKYFPNKFTIQLPEEKSHYSILFQNLATVEICKKEEIITIQDLGSGHYATRKLRNLFGEVANTLDNRPLVLYSDLESEKWAYEYLKRKKNPVIFVPTCSKYWSSVRSLPKEFAESLLEKLKKQSKTPIICQSSSNTLDIEGTWLLDLDLRKYICLLRMCKTYMGANTGDEHLATAVGCKTYVFQPKDGNGFLSSEWNYDHPNSEYYNWEELA